MSGKVTLIGAGPGDAGLLTIKGKEALQNAEVVVYDRLVGADILEMMSETAEKINVGKESRNHLVPQSGINEILLEKAQAGKNVVRLKGGDSFLFGRGGEELELLCEHNIPFEVIPGVTSALSVPSFAGIPVTHRDFCSSVHIITGHAKQDGELHIDFEALKRLDGTLVFLMSVSSMEFILKGLMNAGMDKAMPAALIERGTHAKQRKLIADIEILAEKARKAEIKSPAILIVGKVCTLSDKFDWFDKLPLKGKTVLVTRPKERAGTLSDKLRRLGAEVLPYPCIETEEIVPCYDAEAAISELSSYQWLVLTSPAGVNALFNLLDRLNLDARALAPVKIAVIGNGTDKELRKYGVKADFIPEIFDAKHLANGLRLLAMPGERMLILRAEIGTPELTEILSEDGIAFDDIAVYRTHFRSDDSMLISEKLQNGEIDFVTFTSASTVKGFTQSVKNVDFSKICGICIGESTAKEASIYKIKTVTAKSATIDAIISAIKEAVQNGND